MQHNTSMSGYIQEKKRLTETSAAPRMTALLEAAERVFLQKGYYQATMNDVANDAGMSKKTIYALIESKADLFAAVLAHRHESITFPPPEPGWTIADLLTANLLCLARFLLTPTQIALTRLVMAEYTHSPDFGLVFLRSRVMKAKSKLEDCLIGVARDQGMPPHQAKELSAMLFGMALGEFHMSVLIGFRAPPTKQALESRIRLAVEIFVAGCSTLGLTPPLPTYAVPPPGG